jgi:hypothetical protein
MSISTEVTDALNDIFDDVGDDATYTPVTGDPLSCKVWVMKDVELQPSDFNGQAVEMKTVLECLLSQVLTLPQRGSVFLVGSTTYTVQSPLSNNGRILKLVVK